MKRKYLYILIIIGLITTFYSVFNSTKNQGMVEKEGNYISKYALISMVDWETISLNNSRYSTAEEFLQEVMLRRYQKF